MANEFGPSEPWASSPSSGSDSSWSVSNGDAVSELDDDDRMNERGFGRLEVPGRRSGDDADPEGVPMRV